jgi:hypothetical protein
MASHPVKVAPGSGSEPRYRQVKLLRPAPAGGGRRRPGSLNQRHSEGGASGMTIGRKGVTMILICVSSALICAFTSAFSFWIGRCARRLPIIDDKMPWTMSRAQLVKCPADAKDEQM